MENTMKLTGNTRHARAQLRRQRSFYLHRYI